MVPIAAAVQYDLFRSIIAGSASIAAASFRREPRYSVNDKPYAENTCRGGVHMAVFWRGT